MIDALNLVEKNVEKSAKASAICFGCGMIGTGLSIAAGSTLGVMLCYGVLMGIGLGIGYLTPVKTLMMWFAKHKGLATGIAITGFGLAKVIAAPLITYLLSRFSYYQIGQFYGAELITIPMLSTGPDMDMIEEYVKDPQVKMIWVVPKYSNPDSIIFSDETVKRFANLKPAAPDFAIIWDNAYCIHEFEGEYVPFPDIISLCEEAGRPDMVFEFASTSKITFAGGGTSCMAASEANIDYFTGVFGVQMISYDKVNQLRHVKYLKDKAHTLEIMKRHASVMAPKFRCVSDILEKEIKPLDFASWKRPTGGYFVSLNTMPGTAKRVWKLCKEAGVTMTNAGATFPYGIDPNDSNIRIAPSLPPVEELQQAMEVFTTCLKLAALEKLLNK